MRPQSRRERIAAQLADLKMPGALEALDGVLAGIDGGGTTAAEAIERLLAAQIELRNGRRLEAAMRSSRLPCVKTLTAFDFAFQPSIKREQIDALHELGFVERRENVVFLGPTGLVSNSSTSVNRHATLDNQRRLATAAMGCLQTPSPVGPLSETADGASQRLPSLPDDPGRSRPIPARSFGSGSVARWLGTLA